MCVIIYDYLGMICAYDCVGTNYEFFLSVCVGKEYKISCKLLNMLFVSLLEFSDFRFCVDW